MRVSIIIRCYNEERHIGRLLTGIMGQTVKDREIILVDSGSSDATLAIAGRFPVKIVHIKSEDFSFGYSLNVGCAAATGDFLVIVSAHVYPVYADWLEKLIEPFDDPKVALVYGKQRGDEVTKYSEHRVFERWFPDKGTTKQDHPFCNNANAAVRRSLWEQFPYDETITGLEDLAWSKRILAEGYHLAYIPSAEIIHVHEESWGQVYNRYRREAIAFKRIFPQEHFSLYDFVRMWLGNAYIDSRHALKEGVFWQEFGGILHFRLMQFWGTYRGYRQHGTVNPNLRRRFYFPNTRAPHSAQRETGERIDAERIKYSEPDEGNSPWR